MEKETMMLISDLEKVSTSLFLPSFANTNSRISKFILKDISSQLYARKQGSHSKTNILPSTISKIHSKMLIKEHRKSISLQNSYTNLSLANDFFRVEKIQNRFANFRNKTNEGSRALLNKTLKGSSNNGKNQSKLLALREKLEMNFSLSLETDIFKQKPFVKSKASRPSLPAINIQVRPLSESSDEHSLRLAPRYLH
ncbi:unnamed protein product [Blepharisma stoltei]|uniref:Uncharacterized protein n=1 Tax=Blepharisma stoltei TaxID=1481888 RepID=A0AAU9JFE4_9CILI|nr:unnamed protein product [Blepharisma stoltei]